jgi:hypothetical protein
MGRFASKPLAKDGAGKEITLPFAILDKIRDPCGHTDIGLYEVEIDRRD